MKLSIGLIFLICSTWATSKEISITIDDPEVTESPLYSANERNQKILKALDHYKVKAALFVCGMRIDNPEGKALLGEWDKKGHLIANHSYSHLYFPGKKNTLEVFREDFKKVEPLISGLKNFTKLFRFPYLKEGDTQEKRDGMRTALIDSGYSMGYVTIDASDWYVDERLKKRLKDNPKADIRGYRDFYISHILDRASFYHDLSLKVFGKEIKHTLLIHHSLLNSLFLKDLISALKKDKWKIISAKEAFKDPVFQIKPDVLPAGESIVWSTAKQQGKYQEMLRYPAEDSVYEKDKMDKLSL